MREILFKAKRFDTGEWIDGYLVQQKNNLGGIHTCIFQNFESENRWEMKRVDSNTVCQYTGSTTKKFDCKANIIKTIFMIIMITFMFALLITSCAMFRKAEDRNFTETSMFCQVEDNACWTIYYHKNTKVMWIRNKGSFGGNDLEILVDSDGNPLIWEDSKE